MKVNSQHIKRLRKNKHWSQTQLSEVCGVNLRTIQRLENTGKASLETIRALAAVFQVEADSLLLKQKVDDNPMMSAVQKGLQGYSDFSGRANVADYWWFFLAVLLVVALAQLIHSKAYLITGLLLCLPFIAAGQRRLNDAGQSGWWQLMWLVPFGQVVVIYLLTLNRPAEKSTQS